MQIRDFRSQDFMETQCINLRKLLVLIFIQRTLLK